MRLLGEGQVINQELGFFFSLFLIHGQSGVGLFFFSPFFIHGTKGAVSI